MLNIAPGQEAYQGYLVDFCLACEAEARHMYCFSGIGVISGGVNFLCLGHFLRTIRARAIKLWSCIHLEELRSTLCSVLRLDLLFTVHRLLSSFALRSFSQKL